MLQSRIVLMYTDPTHEVRQLVHYNYYFKEDKGKTREYVVHLESEIRKSTKYFFFPFFFPLSISLFI